MKYIPVGKGALLVLLSRSCSEKKSSGGPWQSQLPPNTVGGCATPDTYTERRAVALLCVDPTQSGETGELRGLCLQNRPRERKED